MYKCSRSGVSVHLPCVHVCTAEGCSRNLVFLQVPLFFMVSDPKSRT